MAEETSETSQRLDELYREHPDGFVKGRDALAKELRAAGDRDEADRVKKLRRPSAAAWMLNRAALESPSELEEFAEASERLEAAQREMLEGGDEAAAHWRSAAEHERRAAGAVVDTAGSLARAAGHAPGERALELVRETLRAATADTELRGRVLRGRLEREQSASTLGTLAAAGPPPRRDPAAATGRQAALARRELRRLEEQLAKAEAREQRQQARVDDAAATLREEKARLSASKREAADLRRQVKAAQRKAGA